MTVLLRSSLGIATDRIDACGIEIDQKFRDLPLLLFAKSWHGVNLEDKMTNNESRAWLIEGYDGVQAFFIARLSIALSMDEISQILQRLASRHLTDAEIVAASLRKRSKAYTPLLEVKADPEGTMIVSVGENLHYIASIRPETELNNMNVSFSALR